jgi:hypothetical protein
MSEAGSIGDKRPERLAPVLEFDYAKGFTGWPKVHYGQKFGPTLIRKAIASGLYVMAEIPEAPVAVAVTNARWIPNVVDAIEVLVAEGWRIPNRIWTVSSLKGVKL